MSMPENPKTKGSLTGAGVALVVIGLLILVPSGLCTGVLGIMGAAAAISRNNWSDLFQGLTEALSFGFIPILLGGVLLWAGLRQRKKK
ncbi:MAG: hypothetical protein ABSC92_01230 [Rhizomicrobium sp.]|jgi:hypothetical protein